MNTINKHIIAICYFGIFNPEYSRNRIFIKGLKKQGVEVLLCTSSRRGVRKYFELIKNHWHIRHDYDVMVVGYPGQQSAILARLLTRKPIVFDALVSLYDSMVDDRAVISAMSIRAYYYWCIDYLSCHCATRVIVDTNAHKEYFVKTFYLPKENVKRIFIGSDDEEMYPLPTHPESLIFKVHFHGCFNPLQGVDIIVKAAKILENESIHFTLIGTGQTFGVVSTLSTSLGLRNITFIERVPYEQLKEYIAKADVSLGIFGTTAKARRVIPNKVYEALAVRSPIVTGRTIAIAELLIDRENVLLCEMGNAEDLARKIQEFKQDKMLRVNVAARGYELFMSSVTPSILGQELFSVIKTLLHDSKN
ncbi:MAG: glycosyltransferase [Candidatus Roizmanbacteria bacterium]|nr:glycosyltransferase [Candidatus Roizmanbacteria bacterium]